MEKKALVSRFITLFDSHKLIFYSCILLAVVAAGTYIYITPAEYESEAVVQYESKQQQNLSLFNSQETAVTERLTSTAFLNQALSKENNLISYYVTKDFRKSESKYASPYQIEYTILGKNFTEIDFTVTSLTDKELEISSEMHGIVRSKKGVFGEEIVFNDLALRIVKKAKLPYNAPALFGESVFSYKIQSPSYLSSQLQSDKDRLSIKNKNGLVVINCRMDNPSLAAQIANSIASHFVNATTATTSPDQTNSITQIDQKIENLGQELAITEGQIAIYKKDNQITDLNFDTEKSLSVLKDLQLQKTQLEMNMASLDNISNYLRKNREGNNSLLEYGAISDPVFAEQIAKLNEKYQINTTSENTQSDDAETEALKNQISERILNTRKRTAVQLDEIGRAIAVTQSQLSMFPEKANSLLVLDRKLLIDKKVYDLMVEKRAQLVVSGNLLPEPSQILKPAIISNLPVSPINWLIICIGLLTGISIATVLSLLQEMLIQTKIRQIAEPNHNTGIPFIGNIANEILNPEKWEESINDLCTRVLMKPETKMITITSSIAGEGKTHIASNFSKAFAAMDKKVLIIDMNPFHADIAESFDVAPERTLADVLAGSCDIHDAVCLTQYPNLDVLSSGVLTAGVNTLLSSRKRNEILNDLRKHYDLIVVDTPGTLNHIDAIPMMKISDLNLFVVRSNTTRKQSVVAAGLIKSDYEIDNMYFILNSVKLNNAANGNGKAYRGRFKKMNNTPTAKVNKDIVPSFLRKIALWFY